MAKKKFTSVILAALMLVGITSVKVFAEMPLGTVVLGDSAFSLDYINDPDNSDDLSSAVVNSGGVVYVKTFAGDWVDNVTGKEIDEDLIPEVTYKDSNEETVYASGDGEEKNENAEDFYIVEIN